MDRQAASAAQGGHHHLWAVPLCDVSELHRVWRRLGAHTPSRSLCSPGGRVLTRLRAMPQVQTLQYFWPTTHHCHVASCRYSPAHRLHAIDADQLEVPWNGRDKSARGSRAHLGQGEGATRDRNVEAGTVPMPEAVHKGTTPLPTPEGEPGRRTRRSPRGTSLRTWFRRTLSPRLPSCAATRRVPPLCALWPALSTVHHLARRRRPLPAGQRRHPPPRFPASTRRHELPPGRGPGSAAQAAGQLPDSA